MDDGRSQVKGQASLVPEEEVFVSPGALSFQIIPHYISYDHSHPGKSKNLRGHQGTKGEITKRREQMGSLLNSMKRYKEVTV